MRARVAAALAALLAAGCAPNLAWRMPTPDHRSFVIARARGSRTCVRVQGGREECWDAVAVRAIEFSADGRHLAYPARVRGGWTVVRDGAPGATWDEVGAPVFSGDGARLAFAARRGAAWCVVADRTPGADFDSVVVGTLAFAPGGGRLAYVARRAGREFAVCDGVAGALHDAVERLMFDPRGKLVTVSRDAKQASLEIDGAERARGDAIGPPAFGAGGRIVCAIRRGGSWWIAADGADVGPFADRAPQVAAAAKSWGYVAREGAADAVVLDGKPLAREPRAGNLTLSRDGTRWAYVAERAEGAFVVDEHGAHPFGLVLEGSLQFVGSGDRWACVAGEPRSHKLFVVVEGLRERRPFDWTAVTRLTRREAASRDGLERSAEDVRVWVAAEAKLIVERGAHE